MSGMAARAGMSALVAAASRPLRATAMGVSARSSATHSGQESKSAARSVLAPRVSAVGLPAPAGTRWVWIGAHSGAGVRGMSGPAWGRSQGPLMKKWGSEDQQEMERQTQEIENASPIVTNVQNSARLSMREYYARRREVVMVVRDDGEKQQMMLEEAVNLSDSLGLDPVMVHNPDSKSEKTQAVIRFIDSGKKRHDFTKKQKDAKKTQQVNTFFFFTLVTGP